METHIKIIHLFSILLDSESRRCITFNQGRNYWSCL